MFAERMPDRAGPPAAGWCEGSRSPAHGHTDTQPRARDDWRHITGLRAEAAAQQPLEHFYLALRVVSAGVGGAIAPYAVVRDDPERGRLAAPFGFVPDGTSYACSAADRPNRAPVFAI
ncbi:hypothetical protein ACFYW1_35195 [Streptomyces sp. NPDC002669]|uniref:hypothetical protein n=1 Tax=Streptomyces sp. NPDC002669 TaxID=3364658 RepID=UPI00367DFAD8